MFHVGHIGVLKQSKFAFPYVYLIAGVAGDPETIKYKGKVVMNEDERSEAIGATEFVSEVQMPCPWVYTLKFLEINDIDFIAHDEAPYTSAGQTDIFAEIKAAGRFYATKRTDGISTSDIILRIINDYDEYLYRQLQRGYKPGDLNISKLKANSLLAQRSISKWKNSFQSKVGRFFSRWRKN